MAKKFDLSQYIDKAESKMDTLPRLTAVDLHLIDPSATNFYSMPGIEQLADNIATVGLLEPPRVRKKGGRYVLVSGHRRLAALRLLVERGEKDPHDLIPVFLDEEPDPGEARDKDAARIALRQLRLIYANSDNRQYSSADKTREVQELTAIFAELKRLGYEFPGKLREHVAAAAHVSESRAARLAVIGKNLTTPKLREAYEAGRLGENAAYEIARRGADVIGRVEELPTAMVCEMTIERLGAVLEGLEKKAAEDAAKAKAYNDGVKAMGVPQSAAPTAPSERAPLTRSKFDAEAYLAERAEEDDAFFEMLSEEADPFLRKLGTVNSRQEGIQLLKECLGRDYSAWLYDRVSVNCSPKGVRLWDANGDSDADIIRTWTAVYDMLCAIALNRAAINIGAEPEDDEGDGDGGPARASALTATLEDAGPQWQTGEPREPGWYCCWATWEPEAKKWGPDREFLYWRGCTWFDTKRAADNCIPAQYAVHKWYPMPDDPEEEEAAVCD